MFEDFQSYVLAAEALFAGLLAVALLVKGDQPDKFLQSAVDFIKKFSRK